ncbi:MAG: single-stranded-DNA-specific exonuclease RecJ [Pseudomonadota bacterium]
MRDGYPAPLARCLAARGVTDAQELDEALTRLLPPSSLTHANEAANHVADAILNGDSFLIIGDYDADGATATAVMVRGLRKLGGRVDFLVPDRFRFGYGLSPALVEHADSVFTSPRPTWIITVDNGISSIEGVAAAKRVGYKVLVTDHHLPGQQLPDSLIINPQLPGCTFLSKSLAGVGVAFYLIMAIRAVLTQRNSERESNEPPIFPGDPPRLDDLLPLVALGTVADLVPLDANNRRLVASGLQRIRKGMMPVGIRSLFEQSGRDWRSAQASDLGFSIGPRLNAAGRLADMSIGIRCLLSDDPEEAAALAQSLEALNRERRNIEEDTREKAIRQIDERTDLQEQSAIILYDEDWHQGVVGLIASKIKDRLHRPALVFARDEQSGLLKGSGRSIPGIHLRDVLERVDTMHPGLIRTFGGHAMAAGLSLAPDHLKDFEEAFLQALGEFADPSLFDQTLPTDGTLRAEEHTLELARAISRIVWGQGFPSPLFHGHFRVAQKRLLKEKHLRLDLVPVDAPAHRFEAIWFNAPIDPPSEVALAYELGINDWQGVERLQLLVREAHCPNQ